MRAVHDMPLLDLVHRAAAIHRTHNDPSDIQRASLLSIKTGGCPEDCHFCSQSGLFSSPVRSAWLDIPSLVEAAKQTAKTGATEFCIVAAVRGPDARLLAQVAAGIEAIDPRTVDAARAMGIDQAMVMGADGRVQATQAFADRFQASTGVAVTVLP